MGVSQTLPRCGYCWLVNGFGNYAAPGGERRAKSCFTTRCRGQCKETSRVSWSRAIFTTCHMSALSMREGERQTFLTQFILSSFSTLGALWTWPSPGVKSAWIPSCLHISGLALTIIKWGRRLFNNETGLSYAFEAPPPRDCTEPGKYMHAKVSKVTLWYVKEYSNKLMESFSVFNLKFSHQRVKWSSHWN